MSMPKSDRRALCVRMSIPSIDAFTSPLREMLRLTLTEQGYGEDFIYELGTAATELVNNSFEHSSDRNCHEVGIGWSIEPERCEFWVHDEGEGRVTQKDFDFAGKGPPDHFEDRGRGLFLIYTFSSEVMVETGEDSGTTIRIRKYPGEEE